MMRRLSARSHAVHGLMVAALLGWCLSGDVCRAGGPACAGPAAVGYGPHACGPQGCGPGVCRHGGGGHHGCRQGHCGHKHCGGHGCGPCGHHGCGPCGACGPCGHGHGCHDGCCLHDSCKYNVWEKRYFLRSQGKSWHSAWYDPWEGRPIALVVPPTAEFQTQYGWGVPSSRVMPIYHQFRRPYPGPGGVAGSGGGGFMPTPNQPSDTVQFGVNAVRGPWGAY